MQLDNRVSAVYRLQLLSCSEMFLDDLVMLLYARLMVLEQVIVASLEQRCRTAEQELDKSVKDKRAAEESTNNMYEQVQYVCVYIYVIYTYMRRSQPTACSHTHTHTHTREQVLRHKSEIEMLVQQQEPLQTRVSELQKELGAQQLQHQKVTKLNWTKVN